MIPDFPILRLGLAGFSAEQQRAIERVLQAAAGDTTNWEIGDLDFSDAMWLNGGRTQLLDGDRIRVNPAIPEVRAVQMHLGEVDRPVAFALPLPPRFEPLCSFDLANDASMARALHKFELWLSPLVAQFCLASHIVEHESALGAGTFELRLGGEPLAFVDMCGDAMVRSTAAPGDFDGAAWQRSKPDAAVPDDFVRTSLSQLMWQYVTRTHRDVLPARYRKGLLYFRRAPRVPQQLLRDVHLFLLRELMLSPATFEELQQRCGLGERRMAHELAALYFVGSITSNPRRAAPVKPRAEADGHSSLPSHMLQHAPPTRARRAPVNPDLTAPAPLRPDH